MRLAVLADIHGNLPAFEAALEHVDRQGVDGLVILGDLMVGAPDSAACWHLARSLDCPILRGNNDRYVAHYDTPAAEPLWRSERFGPLHAAVAQFTPEEHRNIGDLPLVLQLPEAPDILFVHASKRSDHDTISAHTPEAQLRQMFDAVSAPLIVRAHNHLGQLRLWDERKIITCGSVGLALDGHPTAQYLQLDQHRDEWRIRHQSVPYDLEATLRRFRATGYLETAGPMGRLYLREVATASLQLVPFLRHYRSWASSLSLDEAVERFLNLY